MTRETWGRGDVDPELGPGRAFGDYLIERRLGQGGMSTVWLARHPRLHVDCALKVLTVANPHATARLLREARVQAATHPNLLKVLDLVTVDGRVALVLEFVDGPSLADLVATRELTLDEVDAIATGTLDGLRAAHAAGVVHRDLKPSNILLAPVDREKGAFAPKIADFGIAKVETDLHLTEVGLALGTPRYMAPEQLRRAHAVDARADLFSLGCALYELLTRRPPFDGGSEVDLYDQALHGRFPPLATLRPEAPERMIRTIERCLRPDPADRPPDCDALATAWSAPTTNGRLYLSKEEIEPFRARRDRPLPPAGTHLAPDRLGATELGPDEAAHVATCSKCRRDREPLRAFLKADLTAGETEARTSTTRGPRLFGRVEVLREAVALRDGGARLIAIVGPGGVGKTRLATELAHTSPAGVAGFVDLADARTAQDLARSVGTAIGAGAEPTDAEIALALASRGATLLVLDNCEPIVAETALRVGRWLDLAPRLVVVVTSREPLRVAQERVLRLDPLPPGDAREMFRALALAARPDLDVDGHDEAITRLVERLDGLPLAIELAAARVRTMSPTQLLERMPRRFDLLGGGPRDRSPRQATLRGALAWSWDLLDPDERLALAQCSVFRGGFTLEAAERVLRLGPDAWVPNVLEALCDKSLVQLGANRRYRLLESVREYAAEHLAAQAGTEPTEQRHLAWIVAAASDEAPQDDLLELDNLLVALRRAIAWDRYEAVELAMRMGRLADREGPLVVEGRVID